MSLSKKKYWDFSFCSSKRVNLLDHCQVRQFSQKPYQSLMRMTRNKNLRGSPIPMFWTQEIDQKAASRIIRQLKGLNKLKVANLDIPLWNGANILCYRPPRSLTNLNLFLRKRVDLQSLGIFTSNIQRRCTQLRHFFVYFDREYQIRYKDTQIWHSMIQNIKSLQTLGFSIDFHSDQQFKEVQIFLNNLSHFNRLRTEYINIAISQLFQFFWLCFRTKIIQSKSILIFLVLKYRKQKKNKSERPNQNWDHTSRNSFWPSRG